MAGQMAEYEPAYAPCRTRLAAAELQNANGPQSKDLRAVPSWRKGLACNQTFLTPQDDAMRLSRSLQSQLMHGECAGAGIEGPDLGIAWRLGLKIKLGAVALRGEETLFCDKTLIAPRKPE
jgi:hypothetical protein